MNRNNVIILMLAGSLFTACHTHVESGKNKVQTEVISNSTDIPYTVAKRYFQNNQVKQLPSPQITTKEDFDKLFGAAAVMGANGTPTAIDFSKEYVIAVSKPETDFSTTLDPVSLERDEKGNIVFTYKVIKGEKQSYSITPCLLIIVDKKQKGKIRLNEID